jgi:tetrahydromethanopterin S-methyltransferase subunit E
MVFPGRRALVRNIVPGLVLPGLIYLVASHAMPTILALGVASSVPILDSLWRLVRGQPVSGVGVTVIGLTALSVGLAIWLRSPMFILAKGAVFSAVVGGAFAVSALMRRPLTRTLALHLSTDGHEDRHRLAERWRHPKALDVFCTLSIAWGAWLLLTACQQVTLILMVSPGLVMALEPIVHAAGVTLGVIASVAYVRRRQRVYPDLALLPVRSR